MKDSSSDFNLTITVTPKTKTFDKKCRKSATAKKLDSGVLYKFVETEFFGKWPLMNGVTSKHHLALSAGK